MSMASRSYDPDAPYDVECFDRIYRSADGEEWAVRIYQPQGDGSVPVLVDVHGGLGRVATTRTMRISVALSAS